MRAFRLPVAICLCLLTTLAHAAGIQAIDVPADTGGPALHGAMWYPCSEPPSEVKLGYATICRSSSSRMVGAAISLAIMTPPRRSPMPDLSLPLSAIPVIPSPT
jgi:hypothetical protein